MSTSAPEPPRLPTPEDVQAMFDRASTAAQRAETAAQRLEAAEGAARKETESRFPDMPDELVAQVSKATAQQVVEALNASYELSSTDKPADQPAEGADAPADAPARNAPADAPAGEPTPAGAGFRNFAHRILGY